MPQLAPAATGQPGSPLRSKAAQTLFNALAELGGRTAELFHAAATGLSRLAKRAEHLESAAWRRRMIAEGKTPRPFRRV